MADIKTRINPGDTVWWVHCSDKVYKGTVQAMTLCESQGALYCEIYSPSFRRNPYPVVHYSNVFPSRLAADEFAEYQTENKGGIIPMCMGCQYNMKQRQEQEVDNG